jgi:hypothetical protein
MRIATAVFSNLLALKMSCVLGRMSVCIIYCVCSGEGRSNVWRALVTSMC